ncbi:MAG: PEP-CTERM sorting domain-containing protein [Sedimentisphaerales bacterium]|nr:PEP-CTERM sorting domain-containing protein [Sedimentisphaerales bacterium]
MERLRVVVCIAFSCLLSAASLGLLITEITYETEDLGAGRWQYTYEVTNINLIVDEAPTMIEEFTVWFDAGLYVNLTVTTQAPLSTDWDEIAWQPETLLSDPGAFDALSIGSNTGIRAGESVYGFSVAFDWLGTGSPGAQYYEIISPGTFETIDAGYTTPEPATMMLLGLGGLLISKRK